jgi:hypothetical protein
MFCRQSDTYPTKLIKGGNLMKRKLFVVSILMVLVGATVAGGEPIAKEIYYQKKAALAAATYTFKFSLWDTGTVGTGVSVWQEEKQVKVTSSLIKTYLGDTTPLDPADFSEQLWVQVERLKQGVFVVVGTRDKLTASPYALYGGTGGYVTVSSLAGGPLYNQNYQTNVQYGSGFAGKFGVTADFEYLVVPLQIPDGVTITSFSFTCYDFDATYNCLAWLFRDDGYFMASVTTTGSPGLDTGTTTTIGEPMVNNSLYGYNVWFYVNGDAGFNITPVRAIVEYQ